MAGSRPRLRAWPPRGSIAASWERPAAPLRGPRTRASFLGVRAATASGWGALWTAGCFTGTFLAGQPCTSDGDCGPSLRCEDGVCGGRQATSEPATSSSGQPTTEVGGTSTSEGSGETGTSTSSGGTSSTGAGSSSTGTDSSTGVCEADCQQVDLVLIVDDSPSMMQWHDSVRAALMELGAGPVGDLLRASCDVHVGVLPTGAPYEANPESCQGLGALVRVGAGPCEGGAPYATQADTLADAILCRSEVGSAGASDERPVQALLRAITPAYNGADGCNEGFFRPESLLVVLMITDEDDDADVEDEPLGGQTPGTPEDWFANLVAFKGSADRVVMLALTGELNPMTECPWQPGGSDGAGAEAPERLAAFIELFPRKAIDTLCQGSYAGFIAGPVLAQLQAGCAAHAPSER